MTKKTCCFVTLAVDAIHVPASRDGASPGFYHLAALALLIARRDPEGTWSFSIQRRGIAAGEREDMLLAWATRNIPAEGILLGWQLAEAVMPPLFEAAADSDPVISHAFIERLTALLGAPSVDLAVPHGGAGAPPLDVVAASRGLAMRSLAPDEAESAWTIGDRERLQRHAEGEAITAWRLWLAEAGSSAEPVRQAFDDWLNG